MHTNIRKIHTHLFFLNLQPLFIPLLDQSKFTLVHISSQLNGDIRNPAIKPFISFWGYFCILFSLFQQRIWFVFYTLIVKCSNISNSFRAGLYGRCPTQTISLFFFFLDKKTLYRKILNITKVFIYNFFKIINDIFNG